MMMDWLSILCEYEADSLLDSTRGNESTEPTPRAVDRDALLARHAPPTKWSVHGAGTCTEAWRTRTPTAHAHICGMPPQPARRADSDEARRRLGAARRTRQAA